MASVGGSSGWKDQFEKVYELSSVVELPAETVWFTKKSQSLKAFTDLRDELNEVKSLLNTKPLCQWHRHTKNQNPAGFVINSVRSAAKPELLTQAWCKFTEILHKFDDLVPSSNNDAQDFSSLHLCEAPGAFITALNHYLKSENRGHLDWSWVGTTLNPYYEGNTTNEMINDDRFILNTLDHWDFGEDNSGNLMDPINMNKLIQGFEAKGKADLVTADGSINCQTDPAKQELLVCELHFAEIVAALGSLKTGGHFVIKMFTFFEAETLCHLALLRSKFERVDVFKPATSKEGNSEVYVVCQGFKGISKITLNLLLSKLNQENVSLFDVDEIGSEFIQDVKKCAEFFMEIQCNVIKRNVRAFEEGFDKKVKNEEKNLVAGEFLKRHRIRRLPIADDLIVKEVRKSEVYADNCRHLDDRSETGTFLDRIKPKSDEDRLIEMRKQLRKLYPSWKPRTHLVEWTTCPTSRMPEFYLVYGKPFDRIHSSKFCPSRALQLHADAQELAEEPWPYLDNDIKKRKLDDDLPSKQFHVDKIANFKDCAIPEVILSTYPEVVDVTTLVMSPSAERPASGLLDNPSEKDMAAILDTLIATLKTLDRGGHLILLDFFAPLTRLQVGVLFNLTDMFEEVGFVRPVGKSYGIFLSEYKGQDDLKIEKLQDLNKILRRAKSKKNTVLLSVLPMDYITQEPLYSIMVAHNINTIRESSLSLLSS